MKITIEQVEELLRIIDKNHLIAVGTELGPDFLSDTDKETLLHYGIDPETLYQLQNDSIFTSFHLGMLTESLYASKVNQLTYPELIEYIKRGRYIPLSVRELAAINSIKKQSFNDLRTIKGKIFRDINQILIDKESQVNFLKNELIDGIIDKKTIREIANAIAEKTGDWSRDLDRIITYTSTQAFEEGKAAMISNNSGEKDPLVYKKVFVDACKHCKRLYLKQNGEPKIFKLSQLKANGTNIGRPTDQWLPTLGPVHPYCRCMLFHFKGGVWNNETQQFVDEPIKTPKRKPIRVWIGGQETYV